MVNLEKEGEQSHQSTGHDGGPGDSARNGSTSVSGRAARGSGGGVGRSRRVRLASGSHLGVVVGLGVPRVGAGVVVGWGGVGIVLLDDVQNTVASRALALGERNGPTGQELGVHVGRHGTGVGLVQEQMGLVDFIVDIAGLVGHNLENVGTAVL